MSKIINYIVPPKNWQLIVTVLIGLIIGLFLYIFYVSNAVSYLSDNPETCINCHVMNSQYDSWNHSSHRERANCNDCHVPHNNVFNKYFFKAKDGMRHATMFTLRLEPQVIQIKEAGIEVVQDNCIRCHSNLITDHRMLGLHNDYNNFREEERKCWECHREVPHGRVRSLSAGKNSLIPDVRKPIPNWINNIVNKIEK
ncbi:MAG: cytochrome c nitrite reductase small subunit [Marinilabiliales bacterium]|nr:MAG: cytochrome c nitrite reductase small subunit [Marinilabiliales bacterium]